MTKAPPVHANGAAIPAIGLGTWRLAGDEGAEAVRSALEAGYRHIDTAAMYDNEEAVGAGLKASGLPRDEVFVTTKVWPEDLAPGDLERSAEASLKRLRLDAVDLLLIHWPNAAIPLRGSIEALCRVRRAGLARHIGVANFTVALLDEAVALAGEPLVTNQCEYHPYL
ncbi:MAG TPA: aldo/keto reductase, partial [Beijerinckiaceae bacterium]|nr:aldo/keto reductase [Beijerinckiaceae bacterium]